MITTLHQSERLKNINLNIIPTYYYVDGKLCQVKVGTLFVDLDTNTTFYTNNYTVKIPAYTTEELMEYTKLRSSPSWNVFMNEWTMKDPSVHSPNLTECLVLAVQAMNQ